jgi:hypothetical protein
MSINLLGFPKGINTTFYAKNGELVQINNGIVTSSQIPFISKMGSSWWSSVFGENIWDYNPAGYPSQLGLYPVTVGANANWIVGFRPNKIKVTFSTFYPDKLTVELFISDVTGTQIIDVIYYTSGQEVSLPVMTYNISKIGITTNFKQIVTDVSFLL